MSKCTVYSIASQKGGVGKTSSAISIAGGLGRLGKRVLLIDVDPQANASKVLLADYPGIPKDNTVYRTVIDRKPLPIHATTVLNVDVVPSHILLSETDVVMATAYDHREARVKYELDKVRDNYDFVLFDCPPSLGWLTLNAFTASNYVLVVTSYGYFELDSTIQIGKTVAEVKQNFNPNVRIKGFLFNMADSTVNSKATLELLRDKYPNFVFSTQIPRNVAVKNASFNKQDVFSYDPDCPAARAFDKLIQEVFQ